MKNKSYRPPHFGPPGDLRSNALQHVGPWTPPPPARRISAASQARLARLAPPPPAAFNPEACPPARTLQTEKKRFLPFNPPRFHIPKKGPNAGQPVEDKMCIRLLTRTVIAGGIRWESTATLKGGTPKLPASAAGTPFSRVFMDLKGRYGSLTADRLQNFLRFAEYAD